MPEIAVASTSLVVPFADVIRLARTPYNFVDVTSEQLALYAERARRLRDFIVDRVEAERVVVPVEVVVRPSFPIRASKFLESPWEDEVARYKMPDVVQRMGAIPPDDRLGRTARVPYVGIVRLRTPEVELVLPQLPRFPEGAPVVPD